MLRVPGLTVDDSKRCNLTPAPGGTPLDLLGGGDVPKDVAASPEPDALYVDCYLLVDISQGTEALEGREVGVAVIERYVAPAAVELSRTR